MYGAFGRVGRAVRGRMKEARGRPALNIYYKPTGLGKAGGDIPNQKTNKTTENEQTNE